MHFYAEIVKAIETGLNKQGYMVFLCNTFYDPMLELQYMRTFVEHNVIGVISGSDLLDEQSHEILIKNEIPVVLLDTAKDRAGHLNVKVDNYLLAKMAVSHLYDVRAKNISYVSEPIRGSVL